MQGVMSSIFLRQYIHYTKVLTEPAFWQGGLGGSAIQNIHEMEAMHLCLKSSICRKKKNRNFHVGKCWETAQMQLLFVFPCSLQWKALI